LRSKRDNRARISASIVSLLSVDSAINRTRRGLSTTTSCPISSNKRLTQGVTQLLSSTTRTRSMRPKNRRRLASVVGSR
jgi:hypothetical protein